MLAHRLTCCVGLLSFRRRISDYRPSSINILMVGKKRTKTTENTAAPTRQPKKAKGQNATNSSTAEKEAFSEQKPVQPESFFLLKSEPHEFSIDDLEAAAKMTEPWDGVRNYQARNIMQSMRLGDQAFFYHSNCKEPGIVGICEVARGAYPDSTALDPKSKKYDERSTADDPRWYMVDVKMVRKLSRLISLRELKTYSSTELEGMALLSKGRLSVQPVTAKQWEFILALEKVQPEGS